ncbi:MAG: polysaccharide deacetylase family protein [Alphaproteobacteria bacterium]
MQKPFMAVLLGVWLGLFPVSAAMAEPSAVIFMYHRFGEDAIASTNIRIEQFEAHIEELKTGGYTVLPLSTIVDALKTGKTLPDKTVAITIDDAFQSVYTEAWPRLQAAGFPFTVFVSTDVVDQRVDGYMAWNQIIELKNAGVGIGHHTDTHLKMASSGRATNTQDMEKASQRFSDELGGVPKLFAYPYGEASSEVMALIKEQGFVAAFGQHSGVAGSAPDMFYLPRFSLNETYGDIERFRLAANAIALPVADITPPDPTIGPDDDNPPVFGFTVKGDEALKKSLGALNCFASHEGAVETIRLDGGDAGTRIEIRMTEPMPVGRTRVNCTLPAGDGRWRWFGRQFFVSGP